MNLLSKMFLWVGFFLAATFLLACGGSGDGGGGESPKVDPPRESSITVIPSLGAVTDATVNIYQSDGITLLGSGDLGPLGQVTITFNDYSGPVVIGVAGNASAKYFDAAAGSLVDFPAGTTIHAIAPISSGTFAVTMLTELAYQDAVANNDFPLDTAAVNQLNDGIRSWFAPEISNLLSVPTLFDSNTTTGSLGSDTGGKYALRLAALAQLGNSQAAPVLAVLLALVDDIKDGVIDGQNGALVIAVPYADFWAQLRTQLTALASNYGTADLITAVASYPSGPITAVANTTAQSLTVGTAMASFTPLIASGGTLPYTYSYTGTLPAGLSLNASTGAVTGTPDAVYATANVVFSVNDANNVLASTTNTVSFTVDVGTGTSGRWTSTGRMVTDRANHTATLLPNGKVLIIGGSNGVYIASAELYDPVTGEFTATTGSMATARSLHTATLLQSGQVLVTGGQGATSILAGAELYDPATGEFTATTGSMATARSYHTATRLGNGKVLVVGGTANSVTGLASAELYDPATGLFTATTGSVTTARTQHTATILANGKVLVAGGVTASAELYDPASGLFTATTGSMTKARTSHTATRLDNGKVLVTAGLGALTSAELYDPETDQFTATGNMVTAVGRYAHTATLLPLPNGKVLVTGGVETSTGIDRAELYDPESGLFTATDGMATGRALFTATLLDNGSVMVTGGAFFAAELFQ